MKITRKMMGHLYKEFDKDPRDYLALTLNYRDETMEWTVADQVLTTVCTSTPADNLTIDLTTVTLQQLVTQLNANPHYTAVLEAADGTIGAIALLDASGTPGNGFDQDNLLAFSDLTWCTIDAGARELTLARAQLGNALMELRVDEADGEYLDFWLDFVLGRQRQDGQNDAQVFGKIQTALTRVKCNNVALEKIVLQETGITVQVVNLNWYTGNETIFTAGGSLWNDSMVTNSAHARIYPAWTADPMVVAHFGLLPGPSGIPVWGDPRNDNPLVDAFAVIFSAVPTATQYNAVMSAIEQNKMGGTLALAYGPSNPLVSNTVGDNTNDATHVCGPVGTEYFLLTA